MGGIKRRDLTNGDLYRLNVLDVRFENTTSVSDTARIDFTKPLTLGSDTGTIKLGAKLNRQKKIRADIRNQYGFAGPGSLTLTPFIESREPYILDSGYSVGPRSIATRSGPIMTRTPPGSISPPVGREPGRTL